MSDFILFYLVLGGSFTVLSIAAGFALRDTRASMWAKLTFPTVMVIMVMILPYAVKPMMGLPVETTMLDLPRELLLIEFYPVSRLKVDLWVVEGDRTRIYEVPMDPELQKVLTKARDELKDGPTSLVREGSEQADGADGLDGVGVVGQSEGSDTTGDAQSNKEDGGGTNNKHTPHYKIRKHALPGKNSNGANDPEPKE